MNIFTKLTICILVILSFSISLVANAAKKTVRTIEIQTKDEQILAATLYLPDTINVKHKVPLVIFLHSLGSNQSVYATFAETLRRKNIASLTISSRGHYQSTTKLNGKKTYWQNYSNKIFAKYPNDILESVDFIKNNYVAIDTSKIVLVGADVNANAAAIAAEKIKNSIKGLILISPTMSFKGLAPAQAITNLGAKPVTIVVTQNDVAHYKDAKILEKYVSGKVNFMTTKTGGTGDSILKMNPYLIQSLSSWIEHCF